MSRIWAIGCVLLICALAFGADALTGRANAVATIAVTALYGALRGDRLGDKGWF